MKNELLGRAIERSNLGAVLQAQGKLNEAVQCYRHAIALKPDYAEAHNNLGVALAAQGKVEEAIARYRCALIADPALADAHNNLGIALANQGHILDAMICYHRAISLKSNFAEAFCNLGNAFESTDELNEAMVCFEHALTLKPDFAMACNNLGNALLKQNKLEAALAQYERALALKPDYAEAAHGKVFTKLLLMDGDFGAGLQSYEGRWKTPDQTPMRSYPRPLWRGEPLGSGKLLLWGEQGVGDEILFAGLVPDVLRAGIRCALDCDPRLKPVFARSFPEVEVVSGCEAGKDVAAHLPTGSLLSLYRRSALDFAATKSPYLLPDLQRWNELRSRYRDGRKLVGIAWHTNNKRSGRQRSIALQLLRPLLERSDIRWVSLQYGSHDNLPESLLVDRSIDQLIDMDAFAAQVAAMDLVITIDNSTAHLAGALGVPVWVLLPFVPDWRWFRTREDSVWYPCARLFRQPHPGDWGSVLKRVDSELFSRG